MLLSEIESLQKALSMVEGENALYKTRVDYLQQETLKLGEQSQKQSEEIDWVKDAFLNISRANDRLRMRYEYDVFQMWVKAKGDEALIKEYREIIKKFRMNWDE